MADVAWLIPFLPLASWLVLSLAGNRLPREGDWLGIGAIGIAFVLALGVFADVAGGGGGAGSFQWATLGDVGVSMGYRVDSLTSIMLVVVTFVSLMVHIFSLGYMHDDVRYKRYYAILSFFSMSMLGLVLVDNLLGLFIFWELVGLASYLLISHWFEKAANGRAAMKAFITTRIGDVALLLGIALLFTQSGTFQFARLTELAQSAFFAPGVVTAAALLIFAGAVGKSAQFPLYVWLPDAMAGPTPVSALIHAATMVAAGVYLIARSYGIFLASPEALTVVAWIGAITALFAAFVAVTKEDIKQVLAYSTVSQLGYMMLALGVGAYTAGIFHLTTHAFFKALLFLASGSVIHAVETQQMAKMGGLARKMPITTITWIVGAAALAGVPPFSGFWSKDEILLASYQSGQPVLFWIGAIAALLTAFYIARATWLTFFAKPNDEEKSRVDRAHESGSVMTIPLILLAVLAFGAGFLNAGVSNHAFSGFVYFGEVHELQAVGFVQSVAIAVALGGIVLSTLVYARAPGLGARIGRLGPDLFSWVDERIMNGLVRFFSRGGVQTARASNEFDREMIDGAVNGMADLSNGVGRLLRKLQTGAVQSYALTLFAAVAVGLIIYVIGG